MHLTDGDLRAILDGERADLDRETHLEQCQACQQRLQALSERGAWLSQRLEHLGAQPLPSRPSHQRLRAYLQEKENTPMLKKIFARPYRPAWIALGLVVVLALAFAFPPVRAIANSFLGLFRVEHIAVVQVNSNDLQEQLGSSSQLETLFTDSVKVSQDGETQTAADAAEAASLAGFSVRLPQGLQGERTLSVQPGGKMSFTIDVPRVQAVLNEIGRSDIQLPAGLEGATVTVDLQKSVVAMYGTCKSDIEAARKQGYDPNTQQMPRLPDCTTLVQMPSPQVNAPAGLDVTGIGEAYLQLLGMTPEQAAQFSSTIDWTTTFVIPIPRYGTKSQTVSVDGVDATYIQQNLDDHTRQYVLIWVKDDIVYALTGPGNVQNALDVANTIQ